jgi:XcyI restriction endonuclease
MLISRSVESVASSDSKPMQVPSPARQLSFHAMLVTARTQWLSDGLHEALGIVNPKQVKKDINRLVPKAAQRVLAKAGIRDEEVFPTPTVLRAQPTLVGYYRLLLGQPQKQFYTSATGLGPFKRVEETGLLNDVQSARLDEFCVAMCEQLALLVTEMVPPIRPRDVHDLTLLTIGSQFQGANNNRIGREATRAVFLAVKKVVEEHIDKDNDQASWCEMRQADASISRLRPIPTSASRRHLTRSFDTRSPSRSRAERIEAMPTTEPARRRSPTKRQVAQASATTGL